MNSKLTTKELVLGGLLLAIGILLPMIFHSFGMMGSVFLPMHIPVLIGGFLLSPYLALILGIATPIISGALTGMPPMFPMAVIMAFELGAYGIIASVATRNLKLSSIPSIIISMIGGRIVAGLVVAVLVQLFGIKMNPIVFLKGAVVTGLPGIIIQIILIPFLLYILNDFNKKEYIQE